MTSYLYGVWQGGLAPSYSIYERSNVALGTHVGNYPHVVHGIWTGSTFNFEDWTFNATYCAALVATYMETYGVTYAATYYRNVACNVRALEWI